jgi:hypothetical protein
LELVLSGAHPFIIPKKLSLPTFIFFLLIKPKAIPVSRVTASITPSTYGVTAVSNAIFLNTPRD